MKIETIKSLWAAGKTEVLLRRDIKFYNLGVTIPAGTYARVLRRVATDAAEVECLGVQWVEIFIVDIE